ncbi:hypothetical protein CEXT_202531 [Caerostris extrusa]|uniref:Transposase n=1 Tax=Caerostris extrusa TaxID=172846 RepID=A0AAV4W8Z9_CAEEX|nr:hypothetical protein CEXT_202531 [Caerostris extrusa]
MATTKLIEWKAKMLFIHKAIPEDNGIHPQCYQHLQERLFNQAHRNREPFLRTTIPHSGHVWGWDESLLHGRSTIAFSFRKCDLKLEHPSFTNAV